MQQFINTFVPLRKRLLMRFFCLYPWAYETVLPIYSRFLKALAMYAWPYRQLGRSLKIIAEAIRDHGRLLE